MKYLPMNYMKASSHTVFSPKNFRLYSPLSLSMIIAKPYLIRLKKAGMNI